jgi:hypothetical protein
VVSDNEPLRYRMLTGPDDRSFCERVSTALSEGYQLYGGPTLTFDGERVIVGQALVLAEFPNAIPPLGAPGAGV